MKIIEHFTSGLANSDTDVSTSYDDDFWGRKWVSYCRVKLICFQTKDGHAAIEKTYELTSCN